MYYKNAKVYSDGSHYIAIPQENFPKRKGKIIKKSNSPMKDKFEETFAESKKLPKKERKDFLTAKLREEFRTEEQTKEFIERNIERKNNNAIKRRIRLMRKIYLQDWNCFCTFTYDDKKHSEDTFKRKLLNCLRHLQSRKGWKYIGVWERSPKKERLHFHGIFAIPENEMIGTFTETIDYSTKTHRMQNACQNSHFLKKFGRNDFKRINTKEDTLQSVNYLMKYMEKTNGKLIYSRGLPTHFISDILSEDIVCKIGVDGRKALLFDDFKCIIDGEIIGQVGKDTIEKTDKLNQ